MTKLLAPLLLIETVLFVATIVLARRKERPVPSEYVGTLFHLLLLPVVAVVPADMIGRASGFIWIACDVVAGTGVIWTRQESTAPGYLPVRMAGHLFAAIWVASVSLHLGWAGEIVGFLLALGFAAHTLAGGRLPESALAIPGGLMVLWLLLLAWTVHQAV